MTDNSHARRALEMLRQADEEDGIDAKERIEELEGEVEGDD